MGFLKNFYHIEFEGKEKKGSVNLEKGWLADWSEISDELSKHFGEAIRITKVTKLD